jgi:hypothetical protein
MRDCPHAGAGRAQARAAHEPSIRQLKWQPVGCHLAASKPWCYVRAMPRRKIDARLAPVMHLYLDDLAKLGAYGRDKSDVARTFIEKGIRTALENKVIAPPTT